jgi:hypothetical protein
MPLDPKTEAEIDAKSNDPFLSRSGRPLSHTQMLVRGYNPLAFAFEQPAAREENAPIPPVPQIDSTPRNEDGTLTKSFWSGVAEGVGHAIGEAVTKAVLATTKQK